MSEKIGANSIKKDMILIIDKDLYKVISPPEHVKPGKGPAYVQLEMKSLLKGTKKNERHSSSDVFEKAFIEHKKVVFLYEEEDALVAMDKETFEQMPIPKEMLEENHLKLLEENMDLEIHLHEDSVISASLSQHVEKEVIEADPAIKNATATNSDKSATLKGGVEIKVPQYVSKGDRVSVRTEDMSYVKVIRA